MSAGAPGMARRSAVVRRALFSEELPAPVCMAGVFDAMVDGIEEQFASPMTAISPATPAAARLPTISSTLVVVIYLLTDAGPTTVSRPGGSGSRCRGGPRRP